jgi:hypothetical protein
MALIIAGGADKFDTVFHRRFRANLAFSARETQWMIATALVILAAAIT